MEQTQHLTGLNAEELALWAENLGAPRYRGRQLFGALQLILESIQ